MRPGPINAKRYQTALAQANAGHAAETAAGERQNQTASALQPAWDASKEARAAAEKAAAEADAANPAAAGARRDADPAAKNAALDAPGRLEAADRAAAAANDPFGNPAFKGVPYDNPQRRAAETSYWQARNAPDKALEDGLNNTVKYAGARVDAAAAAANKAADEAAQAAAAIPACSQLAQKARPDAFGYGGRDLFGAQGARKGPSGGGGGGGPEGP